MACLGGNPSCARRGGGCFAIVLAGACSTGTGRTAGCAPACADCGCAGVVGVGLGNDDAGGGGVGCVDPIIGGALLFTKPFGIGRADDGDGFFTGTVVADEGRYAGSCCRILREHLVLHKVDVLSELSREEDLAEFSHVESAGFAVSSALPIEHQL